MNKAKDIVQFHKLLDEFLKYLEKAFKKIGDKEDIIKIKMYRNLLSIAKSGGARQVVEKFWDIAKSHQEQIYNHDDQYFLETDLLSFGLPNDGSLEDGLRCKELWNSEKIDKETREDIWASLENLIGLAEGIVN